MSRNKIYYWVPENCICADDGECLDAYPDFGAATMVVSHAAYWVLKRDNENLKFLLEEEIKKNQSLVDGKFGI